MRQRRSDTRKTSKKSRSKLSILIADDHEEVRKGLRHLLEGEGWEICGEATDGVKAVEKTRSLKPDVVIMDIGMPTLNGLDATHQILEQNPLQRILVLTMHDSTKLIRECLTAGVKGFLTKSDSAADLSLAVRALAVDKTFFTTKAVAIARKLTATAL